MGVIYKITSPTGRLYVGQTKCFRKRVKSYRHKCVNINYTNNKLFNSFKKHGFDSHKIEIIETIDDNILYEREKFWIKELDTYCFENKKHLNMSRGGEGGGKTWMFDIERREKQSENNKGANNFFYGKKHSDSTKKILSEKMSEINKRIGRVVPKWGAEKGRLKVIKPVIVYDKNGIFVSEFESVTDAANYLKVSPSCVSGTCRMEHTNVNGYVVRFKEIGYPLKIDVSGVKAKTVTRPVYCFINGENILYSSATDASKKTGVPKTTINRAAYYNNGKPIRSGYIFTYT